MSEFGELISKHNLNFENFASLIGMAYTTVVNYDKGKRVKDETREKIEAGIRVLKNNPDLIRAKWVNRYNTYLYEAYRRHLNEYHGSVIEFHTRFRELFEEEISRGKHGPL